MAQFLNAVVTFYCFYFFRQQRETASVAVCNILTPPGRGLHKVYLYNIYCRKPALLSSTYVIVKSYLIGFGFYLFQVRQRGFFRRKMRRCFRPRYRNICQLKRRAGVSVSRPPPNI